MAPSYKIIFVFFLMICFLTVSCSPGEEDLVNFTPVSKKIENFSGNFKQKKTGTSNLHFWRKSSKNACFRSCSV